MSSWFWGSDSKSEKESSAYQSDFDTSSYSSGLDSSRFDSSSADNLLESGSSSGDPELQSFLLLEQQKAQFQAMIHKMNDICWQTCVGSPESKLGSRTETCISNCVERFIDSTLFITNRFAQLITKAGGGGVM